MKKAGLLAFELVFSSIAVFCADNLRQLRLQKHLVIVTCEISKLAM